MHPASIALVFTHPDGLAALGERLRASQGWRWSSRENDRFGDYLWTSLPDHGGVVRLFAEDERYILDLEWKSGDAAAQAAWRTLLQDLRERVLPALGAGGLHQEPGYGR